MTIAAAAAAATAAHNAGGHQAGFVTGGKEKQCSMMNN